MKTSFDHTIFKYILITILILFFDKELYSQITQWTSKGNGGGGALFSPSISPHNVNEIYMGCDMSELFHTTDLGNTWSEVDFREMQGNNGAEVQFTNDPMIMYCRNFENDLMTPFKTTNGGISWSGLTSDPTFGEAYSLFADINNSNNVLVSDYTTLYFSSNGGTTFAQKYTNPSGCYVAGVFFDGAIIYAGLDNGILVSTNSGVSFALSGITGIPVTEAIVSFAGAKQSGITRFFCVTLGSGDVYPGVTGADHYSYKNIYSIDWGSASWSLKSSGINTSHHPFFVSMSKNNISVAYTGGGSDEGVPIVYKTTNGGLSWIQRFIGSTGLTSVNFPEDSTGYCVGYGGSILKSTNRGVNWITQQGITSEDLSSSDFVNGNTGYACGSRGTIIKTRTGGTTNIVNQISTLLPENFFLRQNFPNPFNPVTHLQFGISKSGFVSLKVFDVLGREIKTLINEIKPAGSYDVLFDGTDLASGVYFYNIEFIDFAETKRMILIR